MPESSGGQGRGSEGDAPDVSIDRQYEVIGTGSNAAENGDESILSRADMSSAEGKKRKSDEVVADTESETMHPGSTSTALGSQTPYGSTSQQSEPIPANKASRSRGLSLRSSMFAKNVDRRPKTTLAGLELHDLDQPRGSGSGTPSGKKEESPTVTVTPALDKVDSNVTSQSKSHGPIRLLSSEPTRNVRPNIASPSNYLQRAQKRASGYLPIKQVSEARLRLRKLILRIQELPPSKDGRHIPLDASREEPLIDERTGHAYVDNFIKSSKYTPWNFLPRQLFAQFSKLANLYFLCVSSMQMAPGLSTTGTYTTIIPLLFFVSISMAKEGIDDVRRRRLDKEENQREVQVLRTSECVAEAARDAIADWAPVRWQALRVGDIVRLERDDPVPADIILLDSKGDNNIAYIETMALDGETNLKTKQPSSMLTGLCRTPEAITAIKNTEIVVEDPNLDLYNFEGKVSVKGSDPSPLTNNEIVYRGSVLRNTPEVIGMVIHSGEECKIRMNANKHPRVKAPSLQARVNKVVVVLVIFVLALALFNTIAYQIWSRDTEQNSWYITYARVNGGKIFASFIIMFNTLIPLSLYVSLEIIKIAQMLLLNDIDMYDEVSNTPFQARTSTINEELGQVSYIFSDKTGTLTENVMRFRKLSVAGTAWFHDPDVRVQPREDLLLHEKPMTKGKIPRQMHGTARKSTTSTTARGSAQIELGANQPPRTSIASYKVESVAGLQAEQSELNTSEMMRYIQRKPHTAFARKARMVFLSMALCHTCLPERGQNDDDVSYQASSPDEVALVAAAKELGYLFVDREASKLTIKTYPNGRIAEPLSEDYEMLDVVDFSSNRRRMSVVVRFPDNRICIVCKGADSVLIERLRLAELANAKLARVEQIRDERRSVEAQQALYRKSCDPGSPRISIARPSFARTSIGSSRPSRDDVDGWLKDRESKISISGDRMAYSPRPSAQISRRSAALSEHRPSADPQNTDEHLVEESLVTDEATVIGRCLQHITDFSTEGLRTLLYGYRFIDEEEYDAWKKLYRDATTSLVDRQLKIEQAGELVEQQLELAGATAIEDKLQQGVPETIERLRRANIKVWMLTGDKRETAINIGRSCRLIQDFSLVVVLDQETRTVDQSIASAIVEIGGGSIAHAVVVVDGRSLETINSDETSNALFLDLCVLVDSVICCRASPSQKASLVQAIRRRVNRVTLAIGDGANDIAMIQEAHVGIGITGKEGLQAARTSDYAIAQFRFLNKLLLVHGRWNYIRTCKYTVATFWKELLFYLTQALYQRWNGYTGTSLYEQWSLSMFNTLFTSLPVIFLGIFEQDLSPSTLIAVPELYTKGQRCEGFNFRVYLSWMFMAASEAMIVFFTMRGIFGQAIFTSGQDVFAMGDMTFTACIIVINCKLQLLEQRNRTIIALICLVIEVGGWFLWNIALSLSYQDNYEYDVKGGILHRFGRNPLWWLCLVLSVASCLLFEIAVRALKNTFFPTDVEVFQELERDFCVRQRFEEASASQLQAGWSREANKASLKHEHEAKAAAQEKREGAVHELLKQPRVMEEGRISPRKSAVAETREGRPLADSSLRRSSDIQDMLSRRFGSIRRESLARSQQ